MTENRCYHSKSYHTTTVFQISYLQLYDKDFCISIIICLVHLLFHRFVAECEIEIKTSLRKKFRTDN